MDRAWAEARRPGLPWAAGEYELLRDQVRRFVKEEIKPHADRWEEDGFIPRPILRRMGELGFFGIRYPAEYGGSEMDAVAINGLCRGARALDLSGASPSRRWCTPTWLRCMSSTTGTKAQRARWMPGIVSGEVITAVAITEPDAGSDVKAHPHPRPPGRRFLHPRRREALHHERCPCGSLSASLPRRTRRPEPTGSLCSSSRRAHRASASPARSTSTAGVPPIRRSSSSTAAASRPRTSSARRARASTRSCATSRTSVSVIAAMAIGAAAGGDRDDARLAENPPRIRGRSMGHAGDPGAPRDARHEGGSGPSVPLCHCLAHVGRRRLHPRGLDGEGLSAANSSTRSCTRACSFTALWVSCARARSSAWRATLASCRSAAVRRR